MSFKTAEMEKTLQVRSALNRDRVIGLVIIAFAAIVFFLFARGVDSDTVSTFIMTPGGVTRGMAPDLTFPTRTSQIVLAGLLFLIGVYLLVFGSNGRPNLFLVLGGVGLVFGFLIYVSMGKRLNFASLFNSALTMSVPIALGALSGILSERSGVTNIAVEGFMLTAAMTGSIVGSVTRNIWFGLTGAMLSSGVLALVHAWLSIRYKVNQVISGTVINIFSLGMTSYISSMYLQNIQSLNKTPRFPTVSIPLLADIPFFGPLLFNNSLFVFGMLILVFLFNFLIFKTRWGLRLRSVGEHPKAADTLGVNVLQTRYVAVLLSGLVAGIAGAYFSLGSVGRFDEGMTAGKGYISLAAMIFGGWNPIPSFLAGVLFGFADSLASSVSILGSPIPGQFINMLPYVITMVVLGGVVGKGNTGPASAGVPYEKE